MTSHTARTQHRETYYTVEIVSRRLGIAPATIRRYTRLGLVVPHGTYRQQPLYSAADLARLRKIVRLSRHLGLNGAGVDVVLRLLDDIAALQREVAALRAEVTAARSPAAGRPLPMEPDEH